VRRRLLALAAATALFVLASGSALAAEIIVTTAADQNGGNPAQCSLREAIQAAILNAVVDVCAAGEAMPTVDVITFAIGSGVQTITVDNTELDELLEPIFIDGTTQPGFAGTPLIELRRGTAPDGAYALRVRGNGSGSTIKGLAISDWSQRTEAAEPPGRGIRVDGASNVTIQGNWFGLRANGTEGGGNATDLTIINGAQNTQVGGSTPAARNVFGGSSPFVNPDSISISGATTTGTRIQGNYFGLSVDGTTAITAASIVFSSGASGIVIGGNAPGGATTSTCRSSILPRRPWPTRSSATISAST
jgi:CSLREA domain-containing protein